MSEFNPYAPPEASIASHPEAAPSPEGMYRDGRRLVLGRGVELPARCIRCNAPAVANRIIQQFSPFLWPLIRRVKIAVPLCRLHNARRHRIIALGGVILILGGGVGMLGVVSAFRGLLLPLWGFLVFLVGIAVVDRQNRIVSVDRITAQFAWLRGVCPGFLDELPDWRPLREQSR